jgi:cupin fold WbuC family metalloprotein
MQQIDSKALSRLLQEASQSSRKRAHLLLHSGQDDPVQRLLIALQPGSYIRPHHHSMQWEILAVLRGRGQWLHFSDAGELLDRHELSSDTPVAQIPVGAWHGFLVLDPDTVLMEIKPGPYRASEFAHWAPPEGDATVTEFLDWLGQCRATRETDN